MPPRKKIETTANGQPDSSFNKLFDLSLLRQIVAGIILTVIIVPSLDYFFSPIDLSGKWQMHIDVSTGKYKGENADFLVVIVQDKMHISGAAEKTGETNRRYPIAKRNPAKIEGSYRHNLLQKDKAYFHFDEQGDLMVIHTIQQVQICSNNILKGHFETTAGEHSGTVTWTKVFPKN